MEIIAGGALLVVHLIMSVWLPIAFLFLCFYILALIIGAFIRALASGFGSILSPFNAALKLLPPPWQNSVRFVIDKGLLLVLWLIAFGSVGLFFRWTQRFNKAWDSFNTSGWENTAALLIGDAVRLVVIYMTRVQDEALKFWAGRSLTHYLSESSDIGPQALSHFCRLCAQRFYELIQPPNISEMEFRWLAATFVVSILLALLFMGIPRFYIGRSPVRAARPYWQRDSAEEAVAPTPSTSSTPPTPSQAPSLAALSATAKTGIERLIKRVTGEPLTAEPPPGETTPAAPSEAQPAPESATPEAAPAAASSEPQAMSESATPETTPPSTPRSEKATPADGVSEFHESHDWARVEAGGSVRVEARGSARVVARDSAHVLARDSTHVEAGDSVHVEATDSAHVVARDSTMVTARGSARVEAGGSVRVEAGDSSHVEATGSAHVAARNSAQVEARDSSSVEARDSSQVVARDSTHVDARDSSQVVARDSTRVEARGSSYVVAKDSAHVEARDSSHVRAEDSAYVNLPGDEDAESAHLLDSKTDASPPVAEEAPPTPESPAPEKEPVTTTAPQEITLELPLVVQPSASEPAPIPAATEDPAVSESHVASETVELVISSMPSFTKLLSLERSLTQSTLVKSCFIKNFSRGTATLEIGLSAPTDLSQIVDILKNAADYPISIEKVDDDRIEARVLPA
ncbi:MAG: hypothetical protein ABIH46_08260 [Chloroflexota bacterium]